MGAERLTIEGWGIVIVRMRVEFLFADFYYGS
jgi:hypothetical protein